MLCRSAARNQRKSWLPGQSHQRDAGDPPYVVGRSEEEARRIDLQAAFLERPTRRLFEEAGITAGMTVLDVGSGRGEPRYV
jgi:hypothetical protein